MTAKTDQQTWVRVTDPLKICEAITDDQLKEDELARRKAGVSLIPAEKWRQRALHMAERSGNQMREIRRLLSEISSYQTALQAEYDKREALESEAVRLSGLVAETVEDLDEAIAVTKRAGNAGGLALNGERLSSKQVADRLTFLLEKRMRFAAAL